MILKDLPQSLRPREKLLAHGPTALGDAELLALLLRTGMPGKNALQLGQELLDTFGGLIGLLHAPSAALGRIKGLGPAKRTVVMAVLELARRALSQQITQLPLFESPASVRDFLQLQLGGKSFEVFAVLFLDSQHRMIAFEEIFRGTLNQTSVYPREIVVRALAHHAAGVVLAHNHPSGSALPSRSDEALTRRLKAALALIDVEVHDHFVVTATNAVSMAELGML